MEISAPVITIDGPSNVGKGTLCKFIAKTLRWRLLDSGAVYRVLALTALKYHIDITSEESLLMLIPKLYASFISYNRSLKITLEGQDISNDIRTQLVADIASKIAVFKKVRKKLLHYQRTFCRLPGLVADGRDMGTVVFPNAFVKIFLDASLEERMKRRMLQLQKLGFSVHSKFLLSEIEERDDRDYNRIIAPLVPANDAIIIDSTNLTIDQLMRKALQYIYQRLILI